MASIVIASTSFQGHFLATLRLARRLREAGHEVTYLGTEAVTAQALEQQVRFVSTPLFDYLVPTFSARGRGASTWGVLGSQLAERRAALDVRAALGEARALAERLRPDLMIFDPFLAPFYLAFREYGIPAVALSTMPLAAPDPDVPPFTTGLMPPRGSRDRLVIGAVRAAEQLLVRCRWGRDRLLTRLGLFTRNGFTLALARAASAPIDGRPFSRGPIFDFHLDGLPEVVLFPQELDLPRRGPLPPHVRYAGLSIDAARLEPQVDWTPRIMRDHLVYCALSTVGRGRDDLSISFLRRVIEAVQREPGLSLVVSTGDQRITAAVDTTASNVRVMTRVPQLQVLRHAHAMVTQGGAGAIKECTHFGVPMVVYPRRADQPGLAARVAHHGLGLRGRMRRDSPADILRKVLQVMADGGIRNNLRQMRAASDTYETTGADLRCLFAAVGDSATPVQSVDGTTSGPQLESAT